MPLYALPHPQSLSPKDRVLKMDSSYLDVFFKSAFVVYAPVCTYRFMYVDGGMCLTVVPVFRQVPLFLVVLVFPRTGSPLSQAAPPCRPNTSGVHLGTTPHLTWLEGTQNAALLHARQLCKCRRAPPRPPRGGGNPTGGKSLQAGQNLDPGVRTEPPDGAPKGSQQPPWVG